MNPLDRSIPLVDLVLRYGRGECDLKSVDIEMRRQEQRFRVTLRAGNTSILVPGYREIPDDDATWNRYVIGDFYDFLDHTHAVMHGMFVSDCCHVLLDGGYCVRATARAWGQIYADWANRAQWLGQSDWSYVPFYTGHISDEFNAWLDAFYEFLQKRD